MAADKESNEIATETRDERDVTVDPAPTEEGLRPQGLEDGKVTKEAVLAVFACCCVYNGYLWTLLMPGVVLQYINADLGPSNMFPWISIVWNLTASVIIVVGGRITDLFGRRWFMIVGALFGMVGALIGALGQSIPQMIAAGVIMGFGGGFQEIVFASVQEIVPNNRRLLTLGVLEFSNLVANFSPMIATTFQFTTPLRWRTCYWFAFGWEGFAALALYLWYKPPKFETKHRYDGKTRMRLFLELDYVGVFLFTAACVMLLVALNWGGRDYAWDSAAVITTLVISVILFVMMGFWETYYPLKHPILPPHLFKSRQFTAITVVAFIGGMLYYSSAVLWPRQSSMYAPDDNWVMRALYSNIFSFGTIISSIITLGFMPYVGHERWQIVGFLVFQTIMIGCLSIPGPDDSHLAIPFVLMMSWVIAPINFLAFGMSSLALKDQTDIGVAQGVLGTSRLIGGAIATAIYTAIQQNRYADVVEPRVIEFAEAAGFNGDTSALAQAAANGTAAAYESVEGATEEVISAVGQGMRQATSESYQLVYQVAVAFGGLAILAALFTRNIPKALKTRHRAVGLENEKGGALHETDGKPAPVAY